MNLKPPTTKQSSLDHKQTSQSTITTQVLKTTTQTFSQMNLQTQIFALQPSAGPEGQQSDGNGYTSFTNDQNDWIQPTNYSDDDEGWSTTSKRKMSKAQKQHIREIRILSNREGRTWSRNAISDVLYDVYYATVKPSSLAISRMFLFLSLICLCIPATIQAQTNLQSSIIYQPQIISTSLPVNIYENFAINTTYERERLEDKNNLQGPWDYSCSQQMLLSPTNYPPSISLICNPDSWPDTFYRFTTMPVYFGQLSPGVYNIRYKFASPLLFNTYGSTAMMEISVSILASTIDYRSSFSYAGIISSEGPSVCTNTKINIWTASNVVTLVNTDYHNSMLLRINSGTGTAFSLSEDYIKLTITSTNKHVYLFASTTTNSIVSPLAYSAHLTAQLTTQEASAMVVTVDNFPQLVQVNVTESIAIENFPNNSFVEVSNFPLIQDVKEVASAGGAPVSITNWPVSQAVNIDNIVDFRNLSTYITNPESFTLGSAPYKPIYTWSTNPSITSNKPELFTDLSKLVNDAFEKFKAFWKLTVRKRRSKASKQNKLNKREQQNQKPLTTTPDTGFAAYKQANNNKNQHSLNGNMNNLSSVSPLPFANIQESKEEHDIASSSANNTQLIDALLSEEEVWDHLSPITQDSGSDSPRSTSLLTLVGSNVTDAKEQTTRPKSPKIPSALKEKNAKAFSLATEKTSHDIFLEKMANSSSSQNIPPESLKHSKDMSIKDKNGNIVLKIEQSLDSMAFIDVKIQKDLKDHFITISKKFLTGKVGKKSKLSQDSDDDEKTKKALAPIATKSHQFCTWGYYEVLRSFFEEEETKEEKIEAKKEIKDLPQDFNIDCDDVEVQEAFVRDVRSRFDSLEERDKDKKGKNPTINQHAAITAAVSTSQPAKPKVYKIKDVDHTVARLDLASKKLKSIKQLAKWVKYTRPDPIWLNMVLQRDLSFDISEDDGSPAYAYVFYYLHKYDKNTKTGKRQSVPAVKFYQSVCNLIIIIRTLGIEASDKFLANVHLPHYNHEFFHLHIAGSTEKIEEILNDPNNQEYLKSLYEDLVSKNLIKNNRLSDHQKSWLAVRAAARNAEMHALNGNINSESGYDLYLARTNNKRQHSKNGNMDSSSSSSSSSMLPFLVDTLPKAGLDDTSNTIANKIPDNIMTKEESKLAGTVSLIIPALIDKLSVTLNAKQCKYIDITTESASSNTLRWVQNFTRLTSLMHDNLTRYCNIEFVEQYLGTNLYKRVAGVPTYIDSYISVQYGAKNTTAYKESPLTASIQATLSTPNVIAAGQMLRISSTAFSGNDAFKIIIANAGLFSSSMCGSLVSMPIKAMLYLYSRLPLLGAETGWVHENCVYAIKSLIPTFSTYWPLSTNYSNVLPAIEARVLNFSEYASISYGTATATPDWRRGDWGTSVTLVPVGLNMMGNAELLAAWTLLFLEYPWRKLTHTYNIVNKIGNVVIAEDYLLSPASNNCRLPGVTKKVLYILTNVSNGMDATRPSKFSVGNTQLSSTDNSAFWPVANGVNPVSADIAASLDDIYISNDFHSIMSQALAFYSETLGAEEEFLSALVFCADVSHRLPQPMAIDANNNKIGYIFSTATYVGDRTSMTPVYGTATNTNFACSFDTPLVRNLPIVLDDVRSAAAVTHSITPAWPQLSINLSAGLMVPIRPNSVRKPNYSSSWICSKLREIARILSFLYDVALRDLGPCSIDLFAQLIGVNSNLRESSGRQFLLKLYNSINTLLEIKFGLHFNILKRNNIKRDAWWVFVNTTLSAGGNVHLSFTGRIPLTLLNHIGIEYKTNTSNYDTWLSPETNPAETKLVVQNDGQTLLRFIMKLPPKVSNSPDNWSILSQYFSPELTLADKYSIFLTTTNDTGAMPTEVIMLAHSSTIASAINKVYSLIHINAIAATEPDSPSLPLYPSFPKITLVTGFERRIAYKTISAGFPIYRTPIHKQTIPLTTGAEFITTTYNGDGSSLQGALLAESDF